MNDSQDKSMRSTLTASLAGFGVALCFSVSGIFIRLGLTELDAPLVGVTWGIFLVLLAYGVLVWWRGVTAEKLAGVRQSLTLQIIAALLVAGSTWIRYIAIGLTEVGVVVALGRLSVPIVLIVAPLLVGQQMEQVTPRVWLGALLIVAGSLVLTFF